DSPPKTLTTQSDRTLGVAREPVSRLLRGSRGGGRSSSDPRGRAETAQCTEDRWQGDTAVKRLRLSSAVRPLADYVAEFSDETVVLTEGNRAIAAIVPLKNVDRESLVLSQHPGFLDLIGRSRAEFAAG